MINQFWKIVEPIPEPKIEVMNVPVCLGSDDFEFPGYRSVVVRVTRVDREITAVELVKDLS